jgi:hypothetical protein
VLEMVGPVDLRSLQSRGSLATELKGQLARAPNSDIVGRLVVERFAIQAAWETAKPLQSFKQLLGAE